MLRLLILFQAITLSCSAQIVAGVEDNNCISFDVFQQKCDSAVVNMENYLNGVEISKKQKQNIIHVYNQLKGEFIGEDINRLRKDQDSILVISEEPDVVGDSQWHDYYRKISSSYPVFTKRLIDQGEPYSYGGGALYFDDLGCYSIHPNGRVPFIICE